MFGVRKIWWCAIMIRRSDEGRSAGRTGQDGIPKPWILRLASFSPLLSLSLFRLLVFFLSEHQPPRLIVVTSAPLLWYTQRKILKCLCTDAAVYLSSSSEETRPSTARRTGFQKVEHPAACSLICSYMWSSVALRTRATYPLVFTGRTETTRGEETIFFAHLCANLEDYVIFPPSEHR